MTSLNSKQYSLLGEGQTPMNAIANNIITGPWKHDRSMPETIQINANPLENVKKLQATHITTALLTIMPMLFNDIHIAGFNLDDTASYGTFIMESVKALLCAHYGIHHPFQDIAESVFVTANGAVEFAKRIELDLTPPEDIDVEIDLDTIDEIEE